MANEFYDALISKNEDKLCGLMAVTPKNTIEYIEQDFKQKRNESFKDMLSVSTSNFFKVSQLLKHQIYNIIFLYIITEKGPKILQEFATCFDSIIRKRMK